MRIDGRKTGTRRQQTIYFTSVPGYAILAGKGDGKRLARIFHKGRRERSENAMNADSERSETFEESFSGDNKADMELSGLAVNHL